MDSQPTVDPSGTVAADTVVTRATRQDLARRGTLTAAVLLVLNVLLSAFGSAIVPEQIGFAVFGPEAALVASLGVGLFATLSYAGLERVTTQPNRAFGLLWSLFLALSLVPLVTVVPQFGVPLAGVALLATMHVTSTVVTVSTMTGALD